MSVCLSSPHRLAAGLMTDDYGNLGPSEDLCPFENEVKEIAKGANGLG